MPAKARDGWIQKAQAQCPEAIPFLVTEWAQGRIYEYSTNAIEYSPWDIVVTAESPTPLMRDQVAPALLIQRAPHFLQIGQLVHEARQDLERFGPDYFFTPMEKGPFEQDVPANPVKRPALFLDRDGTVIELVPYITEPERVRLLPGIVELIRWARERQYAVICVTNQSGIGRGYYTWQDFDRVQNRMTELLLREGVELEASLAAGYYEHSELAVGHLAPGLRKPSPGMLKWAATRLGLDLHRSIMIGDSDVDQGAGQRAGCARVYQLGASLDLFHILTDLQRREDS